jgi:hypothetical protein
MVEKVTLQFAIAFPSSRQATDADVTMAYLLGLDRKLVPFAGVSEPHHTDYAF